MSQNSLVTYFLQNPVLAKLLKDKLIQHTGREMRCVKGCWEKWSVVAWRYFCCCLLSYSGGRTKDNVVIFLKKVFKPDFCDRRQQLEHLKSNLIPRVGCYWQSVPLEKPKRSVTTEKSPLHILFWKGPFSKINCTFIWIKSKWFMTSLLIKGLSRSPRTKLHFLEKMWCICIILVSGDTRPLFICNCSLHAIIQPIPQVCLSASS